ncbi:hypothetical protein GS982_31460 [Rhodococcus hoagii]|nr:hypothetical protein [Prescottella equi]
MPGTAGRTYTVALELLQDSVGGRTLTFTNVKWQWGLVPTVTPTAGATDIYLFTWTGAYWIGSVLAQGIS